MKNRCQKDVYQTNSKVHGCNSARWVLKSLRSLKTQQSNNINRTTRTQSKIIIFKTKTRQIFATAKANPYLPHTCGSFTGTPPAAALLLRAYHPTDTHRDAVQSTLSRDLGNTTIQPNITVRIFTVGQLINFRQRCLSLRSLIPQHKGVCLCVFVGIKWSLPSSVSVMCLGFLTGSIDGRLSPAKRYQTLFWSVTLSSWLLSGGGAVGRTNGREGGGEVSSDDILYHLMEFPLNILAFSWSSLGVIC